MKKFFWKDKSGRGLKNTLSLKDVLGLDNDESWDAEPLHEWANDAEVGDEWEDAANKFTCTSN